MARRPDAGLTLDGARGRPVAPPVAFITEWDDPDEERLAVEGVGAHENGTASAVGVSGAARDLWEVTDLYSAHFEFGPHRTGEVADLAASRVSFDVHGFGIDLLAPIEKGPDQESLQRDCESPFEACIRVEDRTAARVFVPGAEKDTDGLRVPADRALAPG